MPALLLLAAAGQLTTPGAILVDRNRIDRTPVQTPPPAPASAAPPVVVEDEARAVRIAGIRFVGAKAPAPVARAGRPFIGRHATKATLTRLATALSAGYGSSDVALYTVAIPAQSFAKGVVVVRLTEGRIARAQVVSTAPKGFRQLRGRLRPLTQERPLSRATFERQLTLIRAIPGMTAATAFTDPRGTGDLVLTVTPRQKRTRLTGGFSNRGVELLGDGMFDVRGELYGGAVDGDQLTVAASAATDLKRYRLASLGYAAPVGTSGLTASANAAYLETRPRGLDATGRARQAGVTLGYPVIRGFTRSGDVSLAVDGLNSDNAALGNVVTSERSRAARLAASYTAASARRSVSVAGSLSHGLDMLGASARQTAADLGFVKATLSASLAQAIGSRGSLRLSASGQWSDDALPAAERVAIGGEAIGRGFDTAALTGDRGGGGLAEAAWRPLRGGPAAASEIYGFADYGRVRLVPRGGFTGRSFDLASTGAGVRARYRTKAELGLEVARVLDDPFDGYREDWRFSISWRLST